MTRLSDIARNGVVGSFLMVAIAWLPALALGDAYYKEPKVYELRPAPDREMHFGHIGVTGIKARIYAGVHVKVEEVEPGTPAAGKFKPGQTLLCVNGVTLKGLNPFVVLGKALTKAEATDGKLVFDVADENGAALDPVALTIPVLGAYSATWPLDCDKSKAVIKRTAEFYATNKGFKEAFFDKREMSAALACLFLLSTGDDAYLPTVKAYFAAFPKNVHKIGNHTWHNGYNGIACAEYYLRTGDATVLPILQYYCDDARARQKFGRGWTHWGNGVDPGYVAGGLMNPAGAQVVTTLLLAKECGLTVDEPTLLGALHFWYRFAGHGTVPYGDHRPEGALGSNGKDGMSAAIMQVASGARSDTSIYKEARNHLSMSMLVGYPGLVQGHGDEGRGDAIWRGVASAYALAFDPAAYHEAMQRLSWWYDLSRRASGGFGVASCQRFDDEGSGAGVAMALTAPLKTLRITGAAPSKFAKPFTLPEHLWGRAADRQFLSIKHHPAYRRFGEPEPIHASYFAFGSAYMKPSIDVNMVPRKRMLQNVYHERYMIRTQAARALRAAGALGALEKLMRDDDPRVRRAALDGIVDYNYWFGMGRQALKTEALTPGMIEAITSMLANDAEALWVIDGALMALSLAPADEIQTALPLIMPWTTHAEWWLRESAFKALLGLQANEALLLPVLPTLMQMLADEYHTMPRSQYIKHLKPILKNAPKSEAANVIVAGLMRAVDEAKVIPGERSAEGGYNIAMTAKVCLSNAPETTALDIATSMRSHVAQLNTRQIVKLLATPHSNHGNKVFGLYSALALQSPEQHEALTEVLFVDYRETLLGRMAKEGESDMALIDTLVDLKQLKHPAPVWRTLGKITPDERVWRYISINPSEEEAMHPRVQKRFRDITFPDGLADWMLPGFDDSEWPRGQAPIGIGLFERGPNAFLNRSAWGDGEFLLMRTTFECETPDRDLYRLRVLMNQGFTVYLNGHLIHTYAWWQTMPFYRPIALGPGAVKHLKKGTNVLALYGNLEYKDGQKVGQVDVFLEGLHKADLE